MNMVAPVLAAALFLAACGAASAAMLTEDGRANCSIVVSTEAIAPELTAARGLQEVLRQVTGADIAIRRETEAGSDAPRILVGQSPVVRRLLPDVDWDSLGKDGIVIRTVEDDLVLAGGRPRGALYAVYTFLEDVVGCGWWTSSESRIPSKPTLRVPELNVLYVPKFQSREAYYRDVLENPLFAAKLRLNGHMHNIPKEYGGHYSIIGWCHTFYELLPPARYQKDHPEWYSGNQLCMSNRELQKELAKAVIERIKTDPSAGMISVSQNDGYTRCECAECKRIEEEEGSPAGPLIRGINAVAEEVEKEYPDFLVETLAYVFSRKPPLHVKPRHNVLVRLCSIEGWFNKPLYHDINKAFKDDIEGWSEVAPSLFVWDYVTNFSNYILPHPNLHTLGENLRFFQRNQVVGVFEQGDSCTTVGDFVRLRAWLLAHLLWNPNQDERKLVSEFMNGYYGPAAPYLTQYLDLVTEAVERVPERIGCGNLRSNYLTFDDVTRATELFAQAENAVAGDPELAKRVRRERLPLDHVWLLRYKELKAAAEKESKPFLGPSDPIAACDEFVKAVNEWDGRNYSETQSFDSYAQELRMSFLPIPKADDLKTVAQGEIDVQEDAFRLDKLGELTKIVDDPAASNGKAAFMVGSVWDWLIQCPLPKGLAASHPGKWHMYIIARADISEEDANTAFRYGVQSSTHQGAALSVTTRAAVDGKYKTCYLGSFELSDDTLFWLQAWPTGRVRGVYVDHIVLVPDRGDGKLR